MSMKSINDTSGQEGEGNAKYVIHSSGSITNDDDIGQLDPQTKRFKPSRDDTLGTRDKNERGDGSTNGTATLDIDMDVLLDQVATSGGLDSMDLTWSDVRGIFRDAIEKRLFGMYHKCGFTGPPTESFDSRLCNILVKFDRYEDSPPFTVQRLAELLCMRVDDGANGCKSSRNFPENSGQDFTAEGAVITTRPRSRSVTRAAPFLRAQYTDTHKYANAIEKTLGVSRM